MKYADLVNTRMGTKTDANFSNGNTLPIAAMPFGMNDFALQTRVSPSHYFHSDDRVTLGVRLSHCSNVWLDDYGYFTMIPQSDTPKFDRSSWSSFRPQEAIMKPYEIAVNFLQFRCSMAIAPTERGAAGKVIYDAAAEGEMRYALGFHGNGAKVIIDTETNTVTGFTKTHSFELPDNFAQYFSVTFDREIDLDKTFIFDNADKKIKKIVGTEYEAESFSLNIAFKGETGSYRFGLATSFISIEQAKENYRREVEGKTFEDVRDAAAAEWEKYLSLIEIETDDMDQLKTFYSAFYRMFLFPSTFHEYDANGKMYHYCHTNGKIYDGRMYANNGFWDTYKTVYPLYSIIIPEKYVEMCDGFLNFYDETGWLPRWLCPNAFDCMPGTSIDNVFADTVAKGLITDKTFIRRMMEASMKHATTVAPEGRYGRDGIEDYLKYHYVTSARRESVNKTQDYAYGDFGIAVMAKAIGDDKTAKEYFERSLYYRNIFDAKETFMRARDKDGKMRDNWTSFDWGGDYTEGSSWQNSFAVFHDFYGLAMLFGGKEGLMNKIDTLFNTPPYFKNYGYSQEIHEMSEMAAADFGQCALSNQPSFHIPYLYAYMGDRNKTCYWVRKAINELFSWENDGYPGDEDNGSMSGWYVFSSLGFYPVCPGADEYVFGSPSVRRAVLHLPNGKEFVVEAPGNTKNTVYWSSATLNGKKMDTTFIRHEDIAKGGTLEFAMSCSKAPSVYTDNQLPYSVSKDEIR